MQFDQTGILPFVGTGNGTRLESCSKLDPIKLDTLSAMCPPNPSLVPSQDHSSSPKITERIQATMTVATSPRAIVICTVNRSAARSAGACSCSRSQCYVQPEQERTLRSFRQNFRFACLDCPKNSSESLDSWPEFCSRVSTASILLIALSIFYADKRQARPGQRPARSGQI